MEVENNCFHQGDNYLRRNEIFEVIYSIRCSEVSLHWHGHGSICRSEYNPDILSRFIILFHGQPYYYMEQSITFWAERCIQKMKKKTGLVWNGRMINIRVVQSIWLMNRSTLVWCTLIFLIKGVSTKIRNSYANFSPSNKLKRYNRHAMALFQNQRVLIWRFRQKWFTKFVFLFFFSVEFYSNIKLNNVLSVLLACKTKCHRQKNMKFIYVYKNKHKY